MEYPSPAYPQPQSGPLPPTPPGPRSRLSTAVRHPKAPQVALALLIGFASVLSALVAWRASLASIEASRHESLAVQQQARQEQIERELEGYVAQDLRFVNIFQEHALAARELRTQADSLRASDPNEADILDLEAQGRQDLARGLQPFFLGASGISLDADGTVPYDVDYVLGNLKATNVELREILLQRSTELSARSDARSLSLIGVAALLVAALFLLTIAQVTRVGSRVRQMFFAAGGVLVVAGTLGFLLVEFIG